MRGRMLGWVALDKGANKFQDELGVNYGTQLELMTKKNRSLLILLEARTGSSLLACDSEDEFEWCKRVCRLNLFRSGRGGRIITFTSSNPEEW